MPTHIICLFLYLQVIFFYIYLRMFVKYRRYIYHNVGIYKVGYAYIEGKVDQPFKVFSRF